MWMDTRWVSGHKKWWWNEVDNAVKEKQKAWKPWKNGDTKEEYLKAKKAAKTAVYFVKKKYAQTEQFASTNSNSDKNHIFKMAKRLKPDNIDVIHEKCVRNNDGKLTLTDDDTPKAW